MNTPGRPVLEVEDLHVAATTRAGETVEVLRGVTFTLAAGEAVALVGESGSGKSMTCAAIMRLLPSAALQITRGAIRLDGEDILAKSEKQMQQLRGGRIAMVVQDSLAALNPVLRVGHQLDEAIRYHSSLARHARRQRCVDLFTQVGIPSPATRLKAYPHQFSGGMRQRVVSAIALAVEPAVLIADEPTTALDPTVAMRLLGMLEDIRARERSALIFVSHDLGLARRLCSRMVVMYGGRKVEEGPTEALLAAPLHPYTAALIACIPSTSTTPKAELTEIPGEPFHGRTTREAGCSFAPRCPRADARCRAEDPPTVSAEAGLRTVECWHPGAVDEAAPAWSAP